MPNIMNLLVVCLMVSVATGYPDPDKSNPRTNRAGLQLQNSKLSTARGFGKRNGFLEMPISLQEPVLPPSWSPRYRQLKGEGLFDSRINNPSSWMVDGSPELTRTMDKYFEENGDKNSGELRRRLLASAY